MFTSISLNLAQPCHLVKHSTDMYILVLQCGYISFSSTLSPCEKHYTDMYTLVLQCGYISFSSTLSLCEKHYTVMYTLVIYCLGNTYYIRFAKLQMCLHPSYL